LSEVLGVTFGELYGIANRLQKTDARYEEGCSRGVFTQTGWKVFALQGASVRSCEQGRYGQKDKHSTIPAELF